MKEGHRPLRRQPRIHEPELRERRQVPSAQLGDPRLQCRRCRRDREHRGQHGGEGAAGAEHASDLGDHGLERDEEHQRVVAEDGVDRGGGGGERA
ncbi:MAG: hypothetical protein ABSE49_05270, partial [Polyangiaceae bacterium]